MHPQIKKLLDLKYGKGKLRPGHNVEAPGGGFEPCDGCERCVPKKKKKKV